MAEIMYADGRPLDTSRLTDIQAFAMETTKAYVEKMAQYNLPLIVRYYADKELMGGAWRFQDGHRPSDEIKIDMLMDMMKFIERLCPGLKLAILDGDTYAALKAGKIKITEREDWEADPPKDKD